MLERVTSPAGVVYYRSTLLAATGVVHAFSTRIGGVSTGPYASLNLGNPTGAQPPDDLANIQQNYQRFTSALDAAAMHRAWVQQVHSSRVQLIEWEGETEYAETLEAEIRDRFHGQTEADALVTTVPNVLLTVRVADCVPILLASEDGQWVAAVHAGWRGIVAGIIGKAIRALGEAGVLPAQLIAAIGPAISCPHFEVGPEVAVAFTRAGLSGAVYDAAEPGGKPHLDLPCAVQFQLSSAGVPVIDTAPLCTFARADEFFSHRRDHGVTGRLAAVIGRRAP